MKAKLPKMLLTALLASLTAYTAEANTEAYTIRPYKVDNITGEKDVTAEFIADQSGITANSWDSAYAKEGSGTAYLEAINQNQDSTPDTIVINSLLLVREGTLSISNSKVSSTIVGKTALQVGGKTLEVDGKEIKATLNIDNSDWFSTQNGSANTGIEIGGCNGAGVVNVTNGSTMTTLTNLTMGHFYINPGAGSTPESYASADPSNTELYASYGATVGNAELNIGKDSTVNVGVWANLGNATINLIGENAQFNSGIRAIIANDNATMGRQNNADTIINISGKNASYNSYHKIKTGRGVGSATDIRVTGENATFKVQNVLQMGDQRNAEATSSTTIYVGANANAHIAQLDMHGSDLYDGKSYNHEASVIVAENGSYTGGVINMAAGSKFTNNGKVALTGQSYYTGTNGKDWGDNTGWAEEDLSYITENINAITYDVSVAAALALEGGTFTNNGELSVTNGSISIGAGGNLITSGSIILTDSSLTVEAGGTLTFYIDSLDKASPSINFITTGSTPALLTMSSSDSPMVIDGNINLWFSDAVASELLGQEEGTTAKYTMSLSSLVQGDDTAINSFAEYLQSDACSNILVGGANGTYIELENATVDVTAGTVFFNVKNVPEPTTATLSLLALAGLAARRRRK